jgi:hypothetical protein
MSAVDGDLDAADAIAVHEHPPVAERLGAG